MQKITKINKLNLDGSFVGMITTLEKIASTIPQNEKRIPAIDLTIDHMKLLLCGEVFDGQRIEGVMKRFGPFFEDLTFKIHDGDYFKSYMSNI